MSNNKVKGLLKGLRYISQIFENEKEPEMTIGHPTDVKHVAHIGWDGPSVNSPSWMGEFKTSPPSVSSSSAPLSLPTPGDIKEDVPGKWVCEDCSRSRREEKNSSSSTRNLPDIPKSSRRTSSTESPTARERSERHKARRSSKSKEPSDQKQTTRRPEDLNDSPTLSLPDIPRNGRRKKTSRSKPQVVETYKSPYSDPGTGSGTGSIICISKDTGFCQTP